MFGAELPHEEWWKESLTAGSCLVITVLKIGVWEVPAAALLHLRFGGSGGKVSVCHHSCLAQCTRFLSSQRPVFQDVFVSRSHAKPGLCEQLCCQSRCKHSVGEALRALWCFRWLLRVESHPGAPQPRPDLWDPQLPPPGHLPALSPPALHACTLRSGGWMEIAAAGLFYF